MTDKGDKDKDKDSKIGDVIRRVVSIGVGAAFMTEDAIKSVLGDIPLPKDIVNGLMQNAQKAKEDFVGQMREELAKHISKVDPHKIVEEILDNYHIEIEAKLNFTKKGKQLKKKNS